MPKEAQPVTMTVSFPASCHFVPQPEHELTFTHQLCRANQDSDREGLSARAGAIIKKNLHEGQIQPAPELAADLPTLPNHSKTQLFMQSD